MFTNIKIQPAPAKIPVINLLILVDFITLNNCKNPSHAITNINNTHIFELILTFITHKNIAITCPIKIPVHLAHTGNWYPLKLKLLS